LQPPSIVGPNLLLGFTEFFPANFAFTLLQSPSLASPWTTNADAVLTTNAEHRGYQFTLPAPESTKFYRVRTP
jgi:hypothetical protein